mmetsp:Transcript_38960/g.76592  ORF Transcript_38960/g.76592 Transcript_38960/m.76592 type:complete len:592 (-) Transcript_38960:188-1963(-)
MRSLLNHTRLPLSEGKRGTEILHAPHDALLLLLNRLSLVLLLNLLLVLTLLLVRREDVELAEVHLGESLQVGVGKVVTGLDVNGIQSEFVGLVEEVETLEVVSLESLLEGRSIETLQIEEALVLSGLVLLSLGHHVVGSRGSHHVLLVLLSLVLSVSVLRLVLSVGTEEVDLLEEIERLEALHVGLEGLDVNGLEHLLEVERGLEKSLVVVGGLSDVLGLIVEKAKLVKSDQRVVGLEVIGIDLILGLHGGVVGRGTVHLVRLLLVNVLIGSVLLRVLEHVLIKGGNAPGEGSLGVHDLLKVELGEVLEVVGGHDVLEESELLKGEERLVSLEVALSESLGDGLVVDVIVLGHVLSLLGHGAVHLLSLVLAGLLIGRDHVELHERLKGLDIEGIECLEVLRGEDLLETELLEEGTVLLQNVEVNLGKLEQAVGIGLVQRGLLILLHSGLVVGGRGRGGRALQLLGLLLGLFVQRLGGVLVKDTELLEGNEGLEILEAKLLKGLSIVQLLATEESLKLLQSVLLKHGQTVLGNLLRLVLIIFGEVFVNGGVLLDVVLGDVVTRVLAGDILDVENGDGGSASNDGDSSDGLHC